VKDAVVGAVGESIKIDMDTFTDGSKWNLSNEEFAKSVKEAKFINDTIDAMTGAGSVLSDWYHENLKTHETIKEAIGIKTDD